MKKEFIISTLEEFPNLYSETLALIEKEFSYESPNSFAIDFYPLFNPTNFSNCLILINTQDNSVIGHLGKSSRIIDINDKSFPVLFIGGVCIKKDFQGRGLSSVLLNHVLRDENNYTFTCLWSDKLEYYKKFKFSPCVSLYENLVGIKSEISFEKISWSELSHQDLIELQKLYNTSLDLKVRREKIDWELAQNVTSASLMVQRNLSGQIIHYFIKDKGQDLTNVIHEYSDLSFIDHNNSDYVLWSTHQNDQSNILFATLLRIGNKESFDKFIFEYTDQKISITEHSEEKVSFELNQNLYNQRLDRFLEGVFGPNQFKEVLDLKMKSIYFCGLDSI